MWCCGQCSKTSHKNRRRRRRVWGCWFLIRRIVKGNHPAAERGAVAPLLCLVSLSSSCCLLFLPRSSSSEKLHGKVARFCSSREERVISFEFERINVSSCFALCNQVPVVPSFPFFALPFFAFFHHPVRLMSPSSLLFCFAIPSALRFWRCVGFSLIVRPGPRFHFPNLFPGHEGKKQTSVQRPIVPANVFLLKQRSTVF